MALVVTERVNVLGGVCILCRGIIGGLFEKTACDCPSKVLLVSREELLRRYPPFPDA